MPLFAMIPSSCGATVGRWSHAREAPRCGVTHRQRRVSVRVVEDAPIRDCGPPGNQQFTTRNLTFNGGTAVPCTFTCRVLRRSVSLRADNNGNTPSIMSLIYPAGRTCRLP